MLDRILAFFESKTEDQAQLSVDDAAAVLLIEVMMADHEVAQVERDCIAQILARRTGHSMSEVLTCVDSALQRQQDSHDLYQFTRIINDQWDEQQRYELIVDMWRVAFSDGGLDKYEDHRIRRISENLHLHHSHFIRAKAQAQH